MSVAVSPRLSFDFAESGFLDITDAGSVETLDRGQPFHNGNLLLFAISSRPTISPRTKNVRDLGAQALLFLGPENIPESPSGPFAALDLGVILKSGEVGTIA
jgi:hypothetical protein